MLPLINQLAGIDKQLEMLPTTVQQMFKDAMKNKDFEKQTEFLKIYGNDDFWVTKVFLANVLKPVTNAKLSFKLNIHGKNSKTAPMSCENLMCCQILVTNKNEIIPIYKQLLMMKQF